MAGNVTLNGIIVDKDPKYSLTPGPTDGLYLLTEDQQVLVLIPYVMATKIPAYLLHIQGRPTFGPYLGKKVSVEGYLSGRILWSALVVDY